MPTVAKNGIQSEFYPPTVASTPVESVDALNPQCNRTCHHRSWHWNRLYHRRSWHTKRTCHRLLLGYRLTVDGLKPS
ncbi:hypothetical protein [Nostoc sp. JL23]|uniref:hypothetical protein n=1 Tax=Nostoc sp. JL23 TaxID=2815394 RepID=UPI001D6A83EB|nr:hypothetical protein [Nostoc sp. JL23]MBN3875150.1 hypothetical protein [Nostoc sp. JL23]